MLRDIPSPLLYQESTTTVHSNVVISSENEMEEASSLKRPRDEEKLALALPPLKQAKIEAEISVTPPPLDELAHAVFDNPIILSTLIQFIDAKQEDEAGEPSLALSAVNKEAFALRFMSPRLQSFYFVGDEIEQCLAYCQAYVREEKMRSPDHFYLIKSLSLVVDEVNIEQAASLLTYLPRITRLKVEMYPNCRAVDLTPLLKAAQALALEGLSIDKSEGHSDTEKDKLPDALFELTTLRRLTISCFNIQHISEKLGKLKNLVSLELVALPLRNLPKILGDLENLTSLLLRELPNLRKLPEEIGNLKKLTKLTLFNLDKLTALPNSIGQLAQLEELILDYLSIDQIPETISNLHKLALLSLKSLDLLHLPDSLYRLPALSKLELYDIPISSLSEALGNLSSLISLKMAVLDITALPASIGELHNLRKLKLYSMLNLVAFPEEIGNLHALEELIVKETPQITTLPNSISLLKKLKILHLQDLENFLRFPSTISDWSALITATPVGLISPKILPDEVCSLPALDMLCLKGLPQLQELPQEFFLKKALKLFIDEVPSITHPPVWKLGFGHFSPLILKSQASVIFYQAILAALGEKGEVYKKEGYFKMDVSHLSLYWLAEYSRSNYPFLNFSKNRIRIAFAVKTRAQIDIFYDVAIAHGGKKQPGPSNEESKEERGAEPMLDSGTDRYAAYRSMLDPETDMYVGYLLDPDGGQLAVVCWEDTEKKSQRQRQRLMDILDENW
jgi:Leucine-rich repeat (LRR) protein